MGLTLLELCQKALQKRGQFLVPAAFAGSSDISAKRALIAADDAGRWLMRMHTWQAQQQSYTFPTAIGQQDYAIPAGLQKIIDGTVWDRTTAVPISGPTSPSYWETLVSGLVVLGSGPPQFWRMSGGVFSIMPAPDAAYTVAFQYRTKAWIIPEGASLPTLEYFAADTDTCVFEDDLMVRGIMERFQAAVAGVEWEPSSEHQTLLAAALAADGGKPVIDMSGRRVPVVDLPPNIPEGSWVV